MPFSPSFPSSKLFAIAMVLIAMTSIQSGASLAKQLFPLIGPEGVTAYRLGLSALILCLIFRPWKLRLTRKDLLSTLIYGLALGGMNLLFYLAIKRIPLGVGVALEFTGPLAVAVLSSRKPIDFLWVALATLGIVSLLPWADSQAALDPIGVMLALAAGGCWALYIWFGQKAGAAMQGGSATALGMFAGALVVTPIAAFQASGDLLNPSLLPMLLMIAVLSSALPYPLEMIALKRLPPQSFGILMSVEPAIATLAAMFILDEHLIASQWLAIGLVMIASVGTTLTARRALGPAV